MFLLIPNWEYGNWCFDYVFSLYETIVVKSHFAWKAIISLNNLQLDMLRNGFWVMGMAFYSSSSVYLPSVFEAYGIHVCKEQIQITCSVFSLRAENNRLVNTRWKPWSMYFCCCLGPMWLVSATQIPTISARYQHPQLQEQQKQPFIINYINRINFGETATACLKPLST